MHDWAETLRTTMSLFTDPAGSVWPIVGLGRRVSGAATACAALVALPLAARVALQPFPPRPPSSFP